MHILTIVTVSAITFDEILTNDPFAIVLKEVIDDVIIVIKLIWYFKLTGSASSTYFNDFSYLLRNILI